MRRPCSLLTRCLAGALALLFAPDCKGPEGAASAPETADGGGAGGAGGGALNTPEGVVLAASVWTFAWNTEGAVFPDGGGVEVETDLGYRVHVDVGRILSHSVSFGPCDSAPSGAGGGGGGGGGTGEVGAGTGGGTGGVGGAGGQTTSWMRRLFLDGLSIRSAQAHTADTDPSMIETSLIEDLTAPRESEASTSFAASRYCRAHWLLARPMSPTSGPDDVSMDHRSLYVTGTYERDGKMEPFAIDTWWPEGNLQDLSDILGEQAYSAAREGGEARHAFVTVRRSLGTLFDGIDFEVASKDQLAGLAVDNLAGSVQFEVALWTPGESP